MKNDRKMQKQNSRGLVSQPNKIKLKVLTLD